MNEFCSVAIVRSIHRYLSLVKFSHTVFAMPFALIGFVLGVHDAPLQNPARLLLWVILCMIFARNAAMGFNRYADASIDRKNLRTASREIPAGIIQRKNAFWFVIINGLFFIMATYFINDLCFYLSPVALFVIFFYSYTKRFTALCHLVLGLGLSLAPIGAYMAVTARFDPLPLLFSAIVFVWVGGFDILYALQDEEFDAREKLHSIPVLLGRKNALFVSRILHFICAFLVIITGFYGHFTFWYWTGASIFIGLLIYQQSLVKENDISKVNLAFGMVNGVASVIFAFFVILSIL